jgi:hypothetical protein
LSYYTDDGYLVLKARLPAEQGALVVKALEKAMDSAEAERVTQDVLPPALEWQAKVTGDVPAGTSRRLACDAALVGLLEDAEGIPLSVGRQTRSIPPWLRRALQARDGGCRFPGCTHTRFVDGHHIRHWADGGETSLDNLVLLCRYHHRLVHEGGFACERTVTGEVIFRSPDDERLPPYAELPGIEAGEDPVAWLQRHVDCAHIDSMTCVTQWYAGDRMDWDLAVGHMFAAENRAEFERPDARMSR